MWTVNGGKYRKPGAEAKAVSSVSRPLAYHSTEYLHRRGTGVRCRGRGAQLLTYSQPRWTLLIDVVLCCT